MPVGATTRCIGEPAETGPSSISRRWRGRVRRYAKIIAQARTRSQQARVTVQENNFTGRGPVEPGNLALVQLLARVPWVYNEMGARTAGNPRTALSISSEQRYAEGLLVGIERAVPLATRTVEQPSAGAAIAA